jgi:hypothetical protein
MERKRTTVAVLAVLTAALGVGCDDAERAKLVEDGNRAAQAVEERTTAELEAAKETFDEQKAALWEASAPVREKAEEWSDAASAKAEELKESAAAKAEEWSDAASAKAEEWAEKAADALEDWAARRENAANAEKTAAPEEAEAPQENE